MEPPIQETPIFQAIGQMASKAVEAAGNLIDMMIKGAGSFLDNKLTPALGALGDKIGGMMPTVSLGGGLKDGHEQVAAQGRGKSLQSDGPAIEKSIAPGREHDTASIAAPQRNEKFDALLSNAGIQKMNFNAVNMDGKDFTLSGALAANVGQEQSKGASMAV